MGQKSVLVPIVLLVLFLMPSVSIAAPDPAPPVLSARNPAQVYCSLLGYEYKKETTPLGEEGFCILPDGRVCPEWDFYRGLCGREWSACARDGMETVGDKGPNGFSVKGGAKCGNPVKQGRMGIAASTLQEGVPVGKLLNLSERIVERGAISTRTMREMVRPLVSREKSSIGEDTGLSPVLASTTKQGVEETKTGVSGKTLTPLQAGTSTTGSLPSYFDWRNVNGSNWLTPIRNQGACGSCWAFAAIGGVEAAAKIARRDPNFDLDLSEEYLVSDCLPPPYSNCSGGWIDVALAFVRDNGVPDEPCFPYTATEEVCDNRCSTWDRRLWHIRDYIEVSHATIDDIKQALVDYGPLGAVMDISSMVFDGNGTGRCPTTDGIDHAVVIVGYNDTGGYWIIRNSWGTGYQDGGYFKLGYGECYIDSYPWGPWAVIPEDPPDLVLNATSVTSTNTTITGDTTFLESIDGSFLVSSVSCQSGDCPSSSTVLGFQDPGKRVFRVYYLAFHNTTGPFGSDLYYKSGGQDLLVGTVPNTSTYIQRFALCTNRTDCDNVLSSISNLIGYYTLAASGQSYNPFIAIDTTRLEVVLDPYCKANTTSQDAWISGAAIYTNKTNILLGENRSAASPSGYMDARDLVLAMLPRDYPGASDGEYLLVINVTTTAPMNVTVMVWVDWNLDGVYHESENISLGTERVNGTSTFTGRLYVASGTLTGVLPMRIVAVNTTPGPCGTFPEGEVEDYSLDIETIEPISFTPLRGYGPIGAGSNYTIRVNVTSGSNITSVRAIIYNITGDLAQPDTMDLAGEIELLDDGAHSDGAPGDGIYANNWTVPEGVANYTVTVTVENVYGSEQVKKYYLTTQPFPEKGEVLFIDGMTIYDSSERGHYTPYFTQALQERGYPYTVYDWDTYQLWGLDPHIYNYTAWLFSIPEYITDYYWILSEMEAYLGSGGNLLITGQDIGYVHNGDSFYSDYLHAVYVHDNTGILDIIGVEGDPIGDNLYFSIGGGEGAGNQYWPSEIDPISPAVTVFKYDNTSGGGNTSTGSIVSSGSAAIRYDNGTFRVVYYAFGLEAVNTTQTRAEIIDRTLQWFLNSSIYRVSLSCPENNTLTNKTVVEINISASEPLKEIELLAWNGTSLGVWRDTSNVSCNLSLEREGVNNFTVRGMDYWDRNETWDISIERDSTPPGVYLVQPVDGERTTKEKYSITAMVLDDNGIENCTIIVNGTVLDTLMSPDMTECYADLATLPGGVYEITAFARDKAGNTNTTPPVYLERNAPPSFNTTLPGNLTVNDTSIFWLVFNATDPEGDPLVAGASIGALEEVATNTWNWSWEPTYMDAGNHTLVLNVSDMDLATGLVLDTTSARINITVVHVSITGNLTDAEANGTIELYIGGKEINETTPVDPSNLTGVENVTVMVNNTPIVVFEYNFSFGTLNLSALRVLVETNKSRRSMVVVAGIQLEDQNETKIVYLPVHLGTGLVCIRDEEGVDPADVTPLCQGENETLVACDGGNYSGYSCVLNGSTYVVSGLRHSLVAEQEPYCGDGYCNNGETCSSCSFDCGVCPPAPEKSSSGGGSGGFSYIQACTPNWSCTAWSECAPEGIQYRNCTDLNNCGSEYSRPEEERECTPVYTGLPEEWCGDGKCSDTENCTTCPVDCGACNVSSGENQSTGNNSGQVSQQEEEPNYLLFVAGLVLVCAVFVLVVLARQKRWNTRVGVIG